VLSFDEKAGLAWAKLMADGKERGRPRSALDTIIAAIAEASGCVVVTDNEKDFDGVEIINPLRGRQAWTGPDLLADTGCSATAPGALSLLWRSATSKRQ
jgi:hypothetical protein